jgi:hypothetical protein
MYFGVTRSLRGQSSSRRGNRKFAAVRRAAARAASQFIESLEQRQLLSIVAPSHIVVVVEEDRGANAIGDTTNMPYFNQLASMGLVYSNSHGLNTTSQEGEMNYLALFSGSTQGETSNGFNGPYAGGNLAQSLNNKGMSFTGYAEAMPHNGDTTDAYAASPTNPAYDDLYVGAYNPMAQFSNVGTGKTNAQVNQTFAGFPTTAAGYAALPTVSYIIPDTAHNTHGSNDSAPYATDPNNYNFFRQSADTWLKNNLSAYVQWAQQNNSILIITGDEGDRSHGFTSLATNKVSTIIVGATGLVVPGTDPTSINPYNLLRTIEDMYGLSALGQTSTATDLHFNAQGQLAAPGAQAVTSTALTTSKALAVYGQSVTFTATVTSTSTPTGTVTFTSGTTTLGTGTLNASGVATLTTSLLPLGAQSITTTYAGSSNFSASTSAAVAQTVSKASTNTLLVSSAVNSVFGQSVSFKATVTPVSPGAGTPTGTVQFVVDGSNFGSPVTIASSIALSASTTSLSVGTHNVVAVYSSDLNFVASTAAALTQSVSKSTTLTSLVANPTASTFGQSILFTATVTVPLPASGTPTGTVTFIDGSITLGTGTLNASGVATFVTSSLSVASHSITAAYAGNTNDLASSSAVINEVVSPVPNLATTTAVVSSAVASVFGQPVTFTATVGPVSQGSGTPSGTVQFTIDGANFGSPVSLLNGSATSAAIGSLIIGGHSVGALYSGDTNFSVSNAPSITQSVAQASTTTSLVSSVNPVVFGQGVTFTATVAAVAPGAGIPTGSFTFTDGVTALGSGTVNASGVATFTSSSLAVASHSITASYTATTNFAASASSAVGVAVAQASSTTSLASSANPSIVGQSVTFTATVAAVAPSSGTLTGVVTFKDGATILGTSTLNGSGVATFATTALIAASHSITAAYAGSANFLVSTSSALTQQVNTGSTALANDNFANAIVISGTSATLTGTNVNATKQTGEPNHGGNVGGKSVWYTWTAPSSGTVSIDTHGSSFDTLLGVYTGTSVSALTTIASNDDDAAGGTTTSKVGFTVIAGTVYQIAVDGYGGASGSVTLNLAIAAGGPAAPTGLTASAGTFSDGVHLAWTAVAGATAYEVWRSTTNSSASATKVSTADVTVSNFIDTTGTPGTTYYYFVKAKNAAGTGGYSASASGSRAAVSNDNFANATIISGTSITTTGTNTGATKEAGEPNHGGNAGGKSVWYVWTAPTSGTVSVDTHGSSFDTLLGVYTGASVSSLTTIASNDDDPAGGTATSKVTFAATAGTIYYIAVDGYGGVAGSITLHLTLT